LLNSLLSGRVGRLHNYHNTYSTGVKQLVDLYENTASYRRINARLINSHFPGCEQEILKTDAYYECYIRHLTYT
jgi:hypothetical protein